jgi:hypothetical protein
MLAMVIFLSPAITLAATPSDLKFRGSGEIRYMGIFKVYDAQLFTDPSASVEDVLAPTCSRCLQLDYTTGLSIGQFIGAAETILKQQHSEQTLAAVRPQINLLHQNYKSVKEGDRYTLCYDSVNRVTSLRLNDTLLVNVPTPEFATVYFGIWLGEKNAIDPRLRTQLLSGFESKES